MRRAAWTGQHERLVEGAASSVPPPDDDAVRSTWTDVLRRTEQLSAKPARRPRRRLRSGLVGAIVVCVLATSGWAAAEIYTARTGQGPIDAEDLRLGGPGEKLALDAPDLPEVITEESSDIPFPDESARRLAIRQQVEDARRSGPGVQGTTGAIRAWLADAALCSWADQWAHATRSGDATARAEAVEAILASPTWPAVTALDPEPFSRVETQRVRGEDGRVRVERFRDESQFFYLAALGDAALGTDVDALGEVLARNNGQCRPFMIPHLPEADPMKRWP